MFGVLPICSPEILLLPTTFPLRHAFTRGGKIGTYKETVSFTHWLQQIVILLNSYKSEDIETIRQKSPETKSADYNSVEKVFFEFEDDERLIVVLFDCLSFSVEEIAKTLANSEVEEIVKILIACKLELLKGAGIAVPEEITTDHMLQLIAISRKKALTDEEKFFLSEFQLEFLNTGLQIVNDSLVTEGAFPDRLVKKLREEMADSIGEQQKEIRQKEKVGNLIANITKTGILHPSKTKKIVKKKKSTSSTPVKIPKICFFWYRIYRGCRTAILFFVFQAFERCYSRIQWQV